MRYSNLHTHTRFSDGKADMEAFVREAAARDMISIGFSDHSHTPCDLCYCMTKDRYGDYLRALERVKKEAPLPVYAGLELDADSQDDTSPYDYIIASVHYIKVGSRCWPVDYTPQLQEDCIRQGFGGDPIAMLRGYFDILGAHVSRVKPTFVGHFDLPAKFSALPEETEAYRETARAALRELLRICPFLELNTGAMARGYRKTPYPALFLLKEWKRMGGEIILTADAHAAEGILFGYQEAARLAKAAGFKKSAVLTMSGLLECDL